MGRGYEGTNGDGKPASKAYWNALRKLRDAWREVFDEELKVTGSRAMESFESAIEKVKTRLRDETVRGAELLKILDVQPTEDVGQVLLGNADLDDVTPNQMRLALLSEFRSAGAGRHDLRPILRGVLNALFNPNKTRTPRVGSNRHWPRLLQYVRELEDETDWSPDGQGVRLSNAGGRGPVAREPKDPGKLSVIIDPDYL